MANTKSLTEGEILTYVSYYRVVNRTQGMFGQDKINVITPDGTHISITTSLVEESCLSATNVQEEVKITRTELIAKIGALGKQAFTVNYFKKVDEKALKGTLEELYPNTGGKIKSKEEFGKAITGILKSVYQGEERTLTGHLISDEPELGRFKVIDLTLAFNKDKNPVRLVNQQSINWAIIDSIKYVVK